MSEPGFIECVCEGIDLLAYTSGGWEVVERYETDAVLTMNECRPTVQEQPWMQQQSIRCEKGRVAMFRLRRPADSIIATLSAELAGTKTKLQAAETELTNTQGVLVAEQAARARLQSELADEKKERARVNDLRLDALTRKETAEASMQKIRAAIGTEAYERIVPAPSNFQTRSQAVVSEVGENK